MIIKILLFFTIFLILGLGISVFAFWLVERFGTRGVNLFKGNKKKEALARNVEELTALVPHLQSVREEERTSIAPEFHDVLGNRLAAIKMDLIELELSVKVLGKDSKMDDVLEKIGRTQTDIEQALTEVQRIIYELRPRVLDDLGIVEAIEWQVDEFQDRTGVKCEITVDPEDIILDKDRSTAIFRIFQETLTNVARHAKATKVKVSLKEKAGKIELKVRDNGKGITEKQLTNPKSYGITGIGERVKLLGGQSVIRGKKNEGTTIIVRIPI